MKFQNEGSQLVSEHTGKSALQLWSSYPFVAFHIGTHICTPTHMYSHSCKNFSASDLIRQTGWVSPSPFSRPSDQGLSNEVIRSMTVGKSLNAWSLHWKMNSYSCFCFNCLATIRPIGGVATQLELCLVPMDHPFFLTAPPSDK